ncbi:hypothetical protein CGZ94_17070 [Enemella evansiae]|uniref:Uncharacterized protein n=1 Tax=Enemella evansiae TaxID=2016499 RepID=A0A255G443_9ACTN|nr:hypothetical protein CGZ94_17070 [Enemella evansiae]
MSCEEFRAQVARTLHHEGAFLFRQQPESQGDPIGRIRGYADLPGVIDTPVSTRFPRLAPLRRDPLLDARRIPPFA